MSWGPMAMLLSPTSFCKGMSSCLAGLIKLSFQQSEDAPVLVLTRLTVVASTLCGSRPLSAQHQQHHHHRVAVAVAHHDSVVHTTLAKEIPNTFQSNELLSGWGCGSVPKMLA